MKNEKQKIESRINEIRDDLRYRVNLDTDRAVNLKGELEDLEIKLDLIQEPNSTTHAIQTGQL